MTRMLAFVWRGVLAFDRVGSRIPQLIQIWLVEFFFVMSLTFFIGKLLDIHGAFGVPGTGEPIPGVCWGCLAVAVVLGCFFVHGLVRPRIVEGEWAPTARIPVGDADVMMANRRARVSYDYLTSHPSYALLGLLTLPLPLSFWYFSRGKGDSTFYWHITGIVGMSVIAVLALARVLAWYVFRFGRRRLGAVTSSGGMSPARIGWEIAWKPVLMLVAMCYAIVCIPLAVMFWQDARQVAALPVVTAQDGGRAGDVFRVEGALASEPVYWAPQGTGRGGNNYAGAGVLVNLPSGGQALLLSESMTVSDFRFALADAAEDGIVHTQAKVIDEITEDQQQYYGLDESAFPDPPADGRVLVLLTTP
jgi:hypothetical protein